MAYPTTNLLSQSAGGKKPTLPLCIPTRFTGEWLLWLTFLVRPAARPPEHASLSSCHFKQFPTLYRKQWPPVSTCGTSCLHNHHLCHLSSGLTLNNSWFIGWDPKLWVLPCPHLGLLRIYTHVRKSRDKSPGYNLWVKSLAAFIKGDESRSGHRWCFIQSALKTAEFGAAPGLCKVPAAVTDPGDLLSRTGLWKCGILWPSFTLPLNPPLPWKVVEKNSAIWDLTHERLSVLVWENFSWILGEFRPMYWYVEWELLHKGTVLLMPSENLKVLL